MPSIKPVNRYPRLKQRFFVLAGAVLISACSGHPGAGTWENPKSDENQLKTIDLKYDGYADLYRPQDTEARYRCFWQAVSAQAVQLQCANLPGRAPSDIYFTLTVSESDRDQATLTLPEKGALALVRIPPRS